MHFIPWMLRVGKENFKISYSCTQCIGPPPGTTTHGKREISLMRWGAFTRKMKIRCMRPQLLRQADGFQCLCWGKTQDGSSEKLVRVDGGRSASFYW